MSGLAKSYEKAIKKELASHGAWLPITNTLKVGDYGYFEGGVFRALGNIKVKYPDINMVVEQGPSAKIDFSSEGTVSVKLDADGNTTQSFAPLGQAEASLKFKFEKENSVAIKIDEIVVDQLQNIEDVGMRLASKKDWRKKYKVISAIYTGKNCLVICAREAGSEVSINANANLLKEVEVGKASGAFEISSSKSGTFHAVGESGVMALSLFKLNWFGNIKVLSDDQLADSVEVVDEFSTDQNGDLEDDF